MKEGNVQPINTAHNAQVAEGLKKFLASSYTLYQKSLYYHWNVTGPQFVSLHALFMEHYTELQTAIDTIAERIRAVGHITPGTLAEFGKLSAVKEDSSLPANSDTMVKNLLAAHEICTAEARRTLELAEESGDQVTVDLMTQRLTVHEKTAWMLRALLE